MVPAPRSSAASDAGQVLGSDSIGGGESGVTASRFPTLAAAVVLFLLTVAQQPARNFVYDANSYWSQALALITGDSSYDVGHLRFHGVLTAIVYAPAGLVELLVSGAGRVAVLVENALIIAVVGALILPRIVRGLGGQGALAGWLCVGLTWLTVARFAPYPLMDIPAAALLLGALALLALGPRPWLLAAAGVCVGAAFNVRPAYLFAALAVIIGVVALRRRRSAVFGAGVAFGLMPQVVYNLVRGSGLGATPPDTGELVSLQASYAAYIVRYDTVLDAPPQQFYCDVRMAATAAESPVYSGFELMRAMVARMPESLGLLVKKVCAALAWSSTTPYNAPATAERYDLAVPVVLITVGGTAALIVAIRVLPTRGYALTVLATAAAVCVSLTASAPEARFAVPLVLLGIVGCAWAVPLLFHRRRHAQPGPAAAWMDRLPDPRWLLLVVVAAGVLVLAGAAWGLAEAAPPGPAAAATCATLP
jgi:hypothetical protein